MEKAEWTFMDRTDWPEGPWDKEKIDKKVWKDPETSLDCMIHRGSSGAWCGYVGVPKEHKFFGHAYDDHYDLNCHGGLTFSDGCHSMEENGRGICHPADDGDHVWWFGFDCAHSFDIIPGYHSRWSSSSDEYRDIRYVMNEVTELAKQLA